MASIFTKIIKGELPCYKIAETELSIAFLSIAPIQLGHTLIVPKIEIDKFTDLPLDSYRDMYETALPVARAIEKITKCVRVGTIIQGLEVPHCHYHLIPILDASDMSFSKARQRSPEEMESIQKKLVDELALS